ncbi:respiratory-chain NADH dehydrogenase domain 51 kDa subunit [Thermincola ferriacetica]|uniref:Respiratory-chain NADH dehydrogenase domain 51 kDa subunit n=2 Tax=Thermincola TaxID=278993 RepID=D5X8F9_THEPJ|nr:MULTISPECIES: 4Fe-4S dicluster domain-containing protein [Thermincola]ADG80938.1 Respiratory-chain NADH dehydrogenase domain 51 kDa subunit [Thermincola potens JR]KNZ68765.1 respiratory-chain NADH dehydrogenase domain 51 kDa subunit [Thermincola ferriacetica]
MKAETIKLVREAGVVGAGGAGFPSHVKIAAEAEFIIINGAECEPLLRVDQQLMAARAEQLIKGIEAVMEATGASRAFIALKYKYKEAIEVLTEATAGKPVEVFTLGDFFPAGDEQVLVYEVTGRVVPEGGIPLKVGCVVTNVETAINIANAIEGIPVTETYLTVTGEVEQPVTLKLPIGTSISEALALAGVKDMQNKAVIDGGPMMGPVVPDVSQPVTKVTKGLIVLPADHKLIVSKSLPWETVVRRSRSVCIQCSMCTEVCPRHLLGHRLSPHKIMRGLAWMRPNEDTKTALLCCECGACELYGCPMQLSPRQVNAAIKRELGKQGIKWASSDNSTNVSIVREYRKIPSKRLIARLGLTAYDQPAPLSEETYVPRLVRIPLRQHIGAPGIPVVHVGQKVQKGDLVAAIPESALGANVHASINGTVTAIKDYVEIESDGERGGES